jgi:hypothetical protein
MAPMQVKQYPVGASNDRRASGEKLGWAGSGMAVQDTPDSLERIFDLSLLCACLERVSEHPSMLLEQTGGIVCADCSDEHHDGDFGVAFASG